MYGLGTPHPRCLPNSPVELPLVLAYDPKTGQYYKYEVRYACIVYMYFCITLISFMKCSHVKLFFSYLLMKILCALQLHGGRNCASNILMQNML